mmetsp:Transcript_64205/g.57728  ORF Transcript_64205/g.57728 Transcript_64205/m.57728 type:complete len:211 (+) Transcript_64205:33-665(+)
MAEEKQQNHQLLLLNIMVDQKKDKKCYILSQALDLSKFGYFTQNTAKQYLICSSRTTGERIQNGSRVSVGMDKMTYKIHAYKRVDGLTGIAITDQQYPERVIHSLITYILSEFEKKFGNKWTKEQQDQQYDFKILNKLLSDYRDPSQDKMFNMQNELEEIKEIMQKNLSDLLERGEKLDDIIKQSEDVGVLAQGFYTGSKDLNKGCCGFL